MKFDYAVIYNGKFYETGENVPIKAGKTEAKKEVKPKKRNKK